MEQYDVKAYAKINLGLDVVQKLPNGYHEVRMIMQTIGIYDELTIEKADEGIYLTTDSGELPTDENNLIYRAARLMQQTYQIEGGVRIHLRKTIPIAAGMAGGSSDAAATMKGMNQLFRLGLSIPELVDLSVRIGADVPYCILGGTALAEGIGEKLTTLPAAPPCHVLIAKPDISVSTKYVYEHLDSAGIRHHPDIGGMVSAIRSGSLSGILERLENVLEAVTIPLHPVISDLKSQMLKLGAEGSLMSGSGPTVFGIFTDRKNAADAYEQLLSENSVKQIFLTTLP